MAPALTNPKQQAHELIDRIFTAQVSTVVTLLEAMLDPVSVALANAPMDDEPVSKEEARDIVEARANYTRGEIVSNEEVLAEFGLTAEVSKAWDGLRSTPNRILRSVSMGRKKIPSRDQAKAQLRAAAMRVLS